MPNAPALKSLLVELRANAASLPGAEEYVMVHHPVFRVGKKPFVIAGMNQTPTLTVNLGVGMQHQLLDGDERFTRTPYIGQHGWVTIARAACGPGEVTTLVVGSWERVANKKQLAERAATETPRPATRAQRATSRGKAPSTTAKKRSTTRRSSRGRLA